MIGRTHPYTINEARLVTEQHKHMDPYHRDLMRWLIAEVEVLQAGLTASREVQERWQQEVERLRNIIGEQALKAPAATLWHKCNPETGYPLCGLQIEGYLGGSGDAINCPQCLERLASIEEQIQGCIDRALEEFMVRTDD
jgi:hypothetical protein